MQHILSGLWHVKGVVGSFVADRGGNPLATAVPEFVSHGELASAVARIASIFEAVGELETTPQSCTIYFTEHHLYVQRFTAGCLGIIAEPSVNLLALRMASRLAQRKLQRIMSGLPESDVDSSRERWHAQPYDTPPPLAGYEMQAHGTMPMSSQRTSVYPKQSVHQTQPSMPAPTVRAPSNPAPTNATPNVDVPKLTPSLARATDVAAPEARSRQRPSAGRTLVYRGRRYQVPG